MATRWQASEFST